MANRDRFLPGSAEPARVLTSAPPGLPVVVRPSFVKYLVSTGVREAALTVLVAGFMPPAGIGLLLFADDSVDNRVVLGLASVAVVLFLVILLLVSARRQLKDGFRAALLNDLGYHAAGRTEINV